jgi:hypothetical protein
MHDMTTAFSEKFHLVWSPNVPVIERRGFQSDFHALLARAKMSSTLWPSYNRLEMAT